MKVLQTERRPLRIDEICRIAIERSLIKSPSKYTAANMRSALSTDMRRNGVFTRPSRGLFGLKEWDEAGFDAPGPDGRPMSEKEEEEEEEEKKKKRLHVLSSTTDDEEVTGGKRPRTNEIMFIDLI